MRLKHLQVAFQLRELFSIDWDELIEHKQCRPDAEVRQSDVGASDVGIVVDEESLDAFIATQHASFLLSWYDGLAAVTDGILKRSHNELFLIISIEHPRTYTNLKQPRKQKARLEEKSLVHCRSFLEIARVKRVILGVLLNEIDSDGVGVPDGNV